MAGLSPGRLLRDAVRTSCIQIPGAPNALVARLIERMGFDATYLSGAGLSAGVLGVPDVGLFTLSELAQHTAYLTQNVAIPVIVDADTGFGEPIHVERTVSELERAGAAAIQLEDQLFPKRCGHLSGKSLIEPAQMEAKILAAVESRTDRDLVIIARTDARGVDGFDAAVERSKRYCQAGADWIFPEALQDRGEFERFAEAMDVPLLANMTEFGKSPLLTHTELAEMGYSAVLYPVTLLRIFMRAAEAALAVIADEGSQQELLDLMQTREELYDLIGYDDFEERDQRYFGQS